ncbi:hypothetical protein ACJX09_05535 [Enterobacter asburiae]|uniref:hypothetical protein n=1 Tax=Enterobacter asburiae TaxID=61645 RepID=UPI003D7DED53
MPGKHKRYPAISLYWQPFTVAIIVWPIPYQLAVLLAHDATHLVSATLSWVKSCSATVISVLFTRCSARPRLRGLV